MTDQKRRSLDTLHEIDGLLEAHLEDAHIDGRPLANLAAAMAIERSGADRGALLIDQGDGFEPVLALESNLSKTPEPPVYDTELIEGVRSSMRAGERDGSVAAPVLLDRKVTCVLYLEGPPGKLGEPEVELAYGAATRIGALLRSAHLVEELAIRTRNVSTLEALGACLAAGELRQEHIDQAIDSVMTSTRSDDALLILLDPEKGRVGSTVRGDEADELSNTLAAWIEQIGQGELDNLADAVPGPCLAEALRADLVPTAAVKRPVVGFLAARRRSAQPDYGDTDRSFFRAVAHLISGALARTEYFARAAEDPLTETGSRLALQLGMAQAQANAAATGLAFSVVLVDIDRFKEVNDRWGHLAGDEVLRGVAAALRSRLRGTDSVSRYGGDEFVLILPNTDADQAGAVAEKLRELIGSGTFSDQELKITVSIGIATSAQDASDLQTVLSAADRALYRSKSLGRDRVTHFREL